MPEISDIGLVTALLAGTVSFLSPCVLPLVPGYLAYVAGGAATAGAAAPQRPTRLTVLGLSLCFVLGFSTVFVLLGASATALGRLLIAHSHELNLVAGSLVILFGLFMVGLPRPGWLQREMRLHPKIPGGRPASAYVLGTAFAFGWTPCIGPILGAILTLSATTQTVGSGMALLGIYSLGLGLPFLASAAFAEGLIGRLRKVRRLGAILQAVAGLVLVLMGAAMVTGRLTDFSYWMLDAFPALGRLG